MQETNTKSRSWLWWYLPVWFFFAYEYVQILSFKAEDSHNLFLSLLYLLEFGVHEASHVIVFFLPSVLVAAAGSIGEMLFTWLIVVAALQKKAYFTASFGLLWVTLSMNSAGRYMADARPQLLPLVGLGPDPKHDWNYVFGHLGLLPASTAIGDTVRVLGDVAGLVGLALGLYVIYRTAAGTPEPATLKDRL